MQVELPAYSGFGSSVENVFLTSAKTVTVKYGDSSGSGTSTAAITLDKLKFKLNDGATEQVLTGSVRFNLGDDTFIDRNGTLYRNVDPATNSGIASGTINYGNGTIELTSWTPNVDNILLLRSLATTTDAIPVNRVSFRTPVVPVRPSSMTVVVTSLDFGQLTITFDEAGKVDTDKVHGSINYDTGFVDLFFYQVLKVSDNPSVKDEPWYSATLEYVINAPNGDGVTKWINAPVWVDPSNMRYNAIAYTYIPLDSEILGLSATRLPLDGRVPIFRVGSTGIVSATKRYLMPNNIAGQTYTLDDARISYLEIEDSEGTKVPYDMYTVDYDYGTFTLNGDFALNALVAPLTAEYRYQDMGLISDVQISGQITFTKPLTHNYDAADTIVGSALVIGDMQARYTKKFVQSVWNSTWSDEATGAPLTANYNNALYPILVTNKGAIQERWALVFTSNTDFRIVGETSGQIGTGSVNTDTAPINPVTAAPYFEVKKEGWGAGWVSGNVLRFNTIAAFYPIWAIRTVKQSEPSVISDDFQIMLRGDIDRVI